MDFKLKTGEQLRTVIAKKESATVIEAGDMVALASGYIVKAGASSAAIAWCPNGAAAGVTDVEVTLGNEFTLTGTADANFAITDKGLLQDLKGTTNMIIDLGTSSTNVIQIAIGETAGTVGSTANVEFKINKPLF